VAPEITGLERTRLLLFLAINQGPGSGVIIRPEAAGVSEKFLFRELQELEREWAALKNRCFQKASTKTAPAEVRTSED
jgi:Ribonuclease G/E